MCTRIYGMLAHPLEKNLFVRGNQEIKMMPHAVAITKENIIFGHVPRAISPICSIFIRRGGTRKSLITGGRQYSSD